LCCLPRLRWRVMARMILPATMLGKITIIMELTIANQGES
jgi:hypothetical protein